MTTASLLLTFFQWLHYMNMCHTVNSQTLVEDSILCFSALQQQLTYIDAALIHIVHILEMRVLPGDSHCWLVIYSSVIVCYCRHCD